MLISWFDEEDNEFGSVAVVAMERDSKAEVRVRTARMIGSVKEDMGAIFDRRRYVSVSDAILTVMTARRSCVESLQASADKFERSVVAMMIEQRA